MQVSSFIGADIKAKGLYYDSMILFIVKKPMPDEQNIKPFVFMGYGYKRYTTETAN